MSKCLQYGDSRRERIKYRRGSGTSLIKFPEKARGHGIQRIGEERSLRKGEGYLFHYGR